MQTPRQIREVANLNSQRTNRYLRTLAASRVASNQHARVRSHSGHDGILVTRDRQSGAVMPDLENPGHAPSHAKVDERLRAVDQLMRVTSVNDTRQGACALATTTSLDHVRGRQDPRPPLRFVAQRTGTSRPGDRWTAATEWVSRQAI